MIETSRHDDDRHRCMQHFGGHEMAKIVQTKMAKLGGVAMTEEGFRDTVRLPGGDATVAREHKSNKDRNSAGVGGHISVGAATIRWARSAGLS